MRCMFSMVCWRLLGRNWEKSLESFPPCESQSPLLTDFTPPTPFLSKSGFKLVCNVNIVYGNLKSENSQDYAQKPQRNCTLWNSASGAIGVLYKGSRRKHFLEKFSFVQIPIFLF